MERNAQIKIFSINKFVCLARSQNDFALNYSFFGTEPSNQNQDNLPQRPKLTKLQNISYLDNFYFSMKQRELYGTAQFEFQKLNDLIVIEGSLFILLIACVYRLLCVFICLFFE